MNSNLRLGLRYEETDVDSSALVPVPEYLSWVAANEYFITYGDADFTELDGSYSNWLPNVDFNIEVVENVILRASYSETIARQSWTDIQGGTTLDALVRQNRGNAASGDPGLEPLESKNIDFSAEWYYGEGSYVSAGYFHKDVKNYVGITTVEGTPFNIPHPGNGLWYDECNAATGNANNLIDIRQCIFETHADSPYVDVAAQTIQGVPGQDPAALFLISVPTNQSDAKIDGWELAFQHLFGESGFGLSANYTIVDSNISYDNFSLNDQFAIPGLSNSANIVGFYEKDAWTARLAWNWRDEFLSGTQDGNRIANPLYTEEYHQLDAIVSYAFENGITLFAEAFNLTDEYLRVHSRRVEQLEYITQQGPRYGVGIRWAF
jgi:TonB-dependent receptor